MIKPSTCNTQSISRNDLCPRCECKDDLGNEYTPNDNKLWYTGYIEKDNELWFSPTYKRRTGNCERCYCRSFSSSKFPSITSIADCNTEIRDYLDINEPDSSFICPSNTKCYRGSNITIAIQNENNANPLGIQYCDYYNTDVCRSSIKEDNSTKYFIDFNNINTQNDFGCGDFECDVFGSPDTCFYGHLKTTVDIFNCVTNKTQRETIDRKQYFKCSKGSLSNTKYVDKSQCVPNSLFSRAYAS